MMRRRCNNWAGSCLTGALLAVMAVQGAVRINEVVASNHAVAVDEDGDFSDWLELVNAGGEAVPLAGWGLSDDAAAPFRWTFPAVTLAPGAHLLVWASKKDRRPAVLTESGQVLIAESASWKYWDAGTVPPGAWQAAAYDDAAWPAGNARFGHPLAAGGTPLAKSPAGQFYPSYFFRKAFVLDAVPAADGIGAFVVRHHFDDGAVVWLNGAEIYRYRMPPGEPVYTDYIGQGYNVDYNGSWLTNALDKVQALALLRPGTNVCAVSLHQSKATTSDALFDMGLRFQPGTNAALHTNFKISASGCDLYLTQPDGTPADHVAVPVMPSDVAAGRSPDGGDAWRVLPVPTPGAANHTNLAYEGVVVAVAPSAAPGFYADAVTLALGTPTPDAAIYYTTDGSTPTTNALRYTQPLTLTDRSPETNALCLINTGTSYVTPAALQPKARVIRAVAVKPGWMDSPPFGGTWFIGPQTAGFAVPVFSLLSDHANIFGPTGIYGNPDAANAYDWEYPLSVELFAEQARAAGQLMGFRIHGGYSRGMAQKTLRLYARSEYGASTFEYPLFPDQPQYGSYKRFLLRNGGNDWAKSMMRDAVAQELCKHLRHDTQAYRPSVVFLNGEYWGVHNIRERYDTKYLARVYGVDEENVDLIGFPYGGPNAVADEGSAADFNALLAWLGTNTLADAASYAVVTGQVDVANYIDYMLSNMFVVNKDWPGNNIKFWRVRNPPPSPGAPYGHDGRWRWMMFDVDFAFAGWDPDPVNTDMWEWATRTTGSGRVYETATRLFRRLLENAEFRRGMLSRYADQLNTAYLPHRTRALTERIRDAVAPEMPRHIARWPGAIPGMSAWSNQVESICAYARDRHAWEWRLMCSRFGITTAEVCVAVSDIAQGRVQVNSVTVDGTTLGVTDPAVPYPWRGCYFREIPVALRALPRPGHRFVRWLETGGAEAGLTVTLASASQTYTALFEPDPEAQALRAVFLLEGEGNWDADAHWSTGVFPDWPGAVAVIPPPAVPDEDGLPRRNVRVASVPVTVGHVEVDNGAFSNRIRNKKDAVPGCALTFDGGTEAASLTVLGDGTGFTAVEMTHGVVLATDLRLVVSNTVGDAEYGALRLQAGWSGPGGLVKEGPGICTLTGEGKAYAGLTRIREGVLGVTQPAAPSAGAGTVVEPGGQLRLTSGTSGSEPPRAYAFGGPVTLASTGRAGFGGVPGAGAKGGLRYDAGGASNRARLLAPLVVAGEASVHVEGASGDLALGNALTLAGGLAGAAPLAKSGGGRLVVEGDAAGMEGAVAVDNGILQVDADMRGADVTLAGSDAWLCGTGRVGSVSGTGVVSPGQTSAGRLRAQSVGGGLGFAFRFAAAGDAMDGNDLVELMFSETPFAKVLDGGNRISVYLDALPPEGGYALGGFATASPQEFTRFVALADWRFYVPDASGGVAFEGQTYSPCAVALDIGTVPFGGGRILKVARPAHGYAAWRAAHFTLAERADPAVSGPLAAGGDGVAYLLRYALGADRTAPVAPFLPRFGRSGGAFVYAFRRRTDDDGLDYLVVTADDVASAPSAWRDAFEVEGLSVRLLDPQSTDDPAVEIVRVEIVPGPQHPVRFFRLRVLQE
jgi:autotransporter-associated beta strand protein